MALPELIKNLLESGVHFGHLSKHWNPKMKKYIFGKKKKVYIIDLEKTAAQLEEAKIFLKDLSKGGGKVLFVGTKRHIRDVIKECADSCSMPYVVERWVGGLLTNFVTIDRRVKKFLGLRQQKESGGFDSLPSKEVAKLNKELDRMEKMYSGVTTLEGLPQCVFVVDPRREHACVHEANKLEIPVVALIDTDADPDVVDYPVPGNDDAIKSVRVITSQLVEAIAEGIKEAETVAEKAQQEADALSEKAAADDEAPAGADENDIDEGTAGAGDGEDEEKSTAD